MSKTDINTQGTPTPLSRLIPDMPWVIWLVVLSVLMALGSDLSAPQMIQAFNTGWGRALGEFALILLPSLTIAAAINLQQPALSGRWASIAAPLAGAGMVCPDTAYAALAPAAGKNRLQVAFGAYTGFKLLFPGGPLIVAAGLGLADEGVIIWTILFTLPIWAVGVIWASRFQRDQIATPSPNANGNTLAAVILPFATLAVALVTGMVLELGHLPVWDFFTQPKGALILAAIVALAPLSRSNRRACLDSGIRRTGSLLLIIGAASAFGAMLVTVLPVDQFVASGDALTGTAAIIGLFLLTVAFKLMQGSSMATFATITGVAAPLVISSGLPPLAAIFAICFGSFVAILPNESFYWLVREDALRDRAGMKASGILAGGAVLQGTAGLILVLLANGFGWL